VEGRRSKRVFRQGCDNYDYDTIQIQGRVAREREKVNERRDSFGGNRIGGRDRPVRLPVGGQSVM
jgi:hypothetical protein